MDDGLAPTFEAGLDGADLNHGEVEAAHGFFLSGAASGAGRQLGSSPRNSF